MTLIADIFSGSDWAAVMQVRSFHSAFAMVAGWLRSEEASMIAYLKEENRVGQIECRERLGGLLRFYHRKAA
jgi:hypothetical protein